MLHFILISLVDDIMIQLNLVGGFLSLFVAVLFLLIGTSMIRDGVVDEKTSIVGDLKKIKKNIHEGFLLIGYGLLTVLFGLYSLIAIAVFYFCFYIVKGIIVLRNLKS